MARSGKNACMMADHAPRLICIAGAESTGKSWLAQRLADHLGCTAVREYGRDYCLAHGNAVSMEELVHIGQQQERLLADALDAAAGAGESYVIADTDALVTAVWADMMYGWRDPWFAGDRLVADLHLVTANDIAWERDAIRVYGADEDRQRFRNLLVAEIAARGGRVAEIPGEGAARFANALAAIERMEPAASPC
jgi:NadR type nicotinamide-nucleotide adenylyltransferase